MVAVSTVAGLVEEVLLRQVRLRAEKTGELLEDCIDAVRNTTAGRMLTKLTDGPYRNHSPEEWQAELARQREEDYRDRRIILDSLPSRPSRTRQAAGAL